MGWVWQEQLIFNSEVKKQASMPKHSPPILPECSNLPVRGCPSSVLWLSNTLITTTTPILYTHLSPSYVGLSPTWQMLSPKTSKLSNVTCQQSLWIHNPIWACLYLWMGLNHWKRSEGDVSKASGRITGQEGGGGGDSLQYQLHQT